jgi:hypothetical protein
MAVTQTRDLAPLEMDVPCPVINQDEIVSCAVHLYETQHVPV